MNEVIERVKFASFDDAIAEERKQLAMEAKSLLGYNRLAQALTIPDALMFGLRKLGIEPLSPVGVEAYKRKKARPGMWSDTRTGLWLFAAVIICYLVLTPWANRYADWNHGNAPAFAVVGTIVLGVGLLVSAFIHVLDNTHGGAYRIIRDWYTVPISEFAGAIPEFVLQRAIQIKKECPKAELKINYLVEEERRNLRRDPDPFLVAALGSECYYIDVWDEREYESTI
jgi:hypothetical protein